MSPGLEMVVRDNLKKRLAELGPGSHADCAEFMGLSGVTLSQIKSGRIRIRLDHLEHMAGFLGCHPSKLFEGFDSKCD